jgi:hypothetical protein
MDKPLNSQTAVVNFAAKMLEDIVFMERTEEKLGRLLKESEDRRAQLVNKLATLLATPMPEELVEYLQAKPAVNQKVSVSYLELWKNGEKVALPSGATYELLCPCDSTICIPRSEGSTPDVLRFCSGIESVGKSWCTTYAVFSSREAAELFQSYINSFGDARQSATFLRAPEPDKALSKRMFTTLLQHHQTIQDKIDEMIRKSEIPREAPTPNPGSPCEFECYPNQLNSFNIHRAYSRYEGSAFDCFPVDQIAVIFGSYCDNDISHIRSNFRDDQLLAVFVLYAIDGSVSKCAFVCFASKEYTKFMFESKTVVIGTSPIKLEPYNPEELRIRFGFDRKLYSTQQKSRKK